MPPSIDSILRGCLGTGNCGPYPLQQPDKSRIFAEVVKHLAINDPSIDYRTPKEFSQAVIGSRAFDHPQTRGHVQYCTHDPIINIAKTHNLAYKQAVSEIAHTYGLNIDDLFTINTRNKYYPYRDNTVFLDKITGGYQLRHIPNSINTNSRTWDYWFTLMYSQADGDFISAEAYYKCQNSNEYFSIYLHHKQCMYDHPYSCKEIWPGYMYNTSILMNRNLILDYSNKPIIIFHDKLLAQGLSQNYLSDNYYPFIPSTFSSISIAPNVLQLDDLDCRDVIIVPISTVESFRSAYDQANEILNSGAANVKICTIPILPFAYDNDSPSVDRENIFIRHILTRAKCHGGIDYTTFFQNDAPLLSVNGYAKWLTEYGLLQNESHRSYGFVDLSDLDNMHIDVNNELSIHNFFSPETISVCYGDTHSGKSLVSKTLALSFATGFDVFKFQSNSSAPVLYLDYENPLDKSIQLFKQLKNAYDINAKMLERNFKYIPKMSDNPICYHFDYNKQNEYFLDIEEKIKDNHIKLLIIDNLNDICPALSSSMKIFNGFISWLRSINIKYKLAILLLHHTNKEGYIEGTKRLINIADNIIKISKIDNLNSQKGCRASITIEKSRRSTTLVNTISGYFLDYYPVDGHYKPWGDLDNHGDNTIQPIRLKDINLSQFKDDEQDIIRLLIKVNCPISLNDICKKLGKNCSRRTIGNRIKSINSNQTQFKIQQVESGPSTKYKLVPITTIEQAASQGQPPNDG